MPRSLIPAVFVVGAVSQYAGAAIGVGLFDQLSPAAVAWLRAFGAAVVLMVAVRPRRSGFSRGRLRTAAGFGCVTVVMNIAFYEAISRIDLGTAVAIEFLGPIAVAIAGSRRPRDYLAAVAATVAVVCVAGVHIDGIVDADGGGANGVIGVSCALLAAAMWAGYTVLGKRVADAGGGIEGLAVGLAAASVILAVPALGFDLLTRPGAFVSWRVPVLGVGLGVLSSVIPYVLDQVVLRRLGRARFALLLSLLPVTAAIVGAVALAQHPGWPEIVGIGLVVAAIAGTSTPPRRRGEPADGVSAPGVRPPGG